MSSSLEISAVRLASDDVSLVISLDGEVIVRGEGMSTEDLDYVLFQLGRDPSRRNPFFFGVQDELLWLILDGFFYGSLNAALRASAEEQTWARHNVTPGVSGHLVSKMFLVACENDEERLLFAGNGLPMRKACLKEGEFNLAVGRLRAQLAEESQGAGAR